MKVYDMIQELAQFSPDAKVIVNVEAKQVDVYNHRIDDYDCVDFERSSDDIDVTESIRGEAVIGVGIR